MCGLDLVKRQDSMCERKDILGFLLPFDEWEIAEAYVIERKNCTIVPKRV